ncbi:MAG: hypothetical protein WCJ99_18935 [Betaproteobacteria bacterium]|jgi:hypothetical protein
MFKNKKLIGLMMSVAITLLMASVYLFSLQLMDDSPTTQEELAQEVQESSEAVSEQAHSGKETSNANESKSKSAEVHSLTPQEKKAEIKSQAKTEKNSTDSSHDNEPKQEVKMATSQPQQEQGSSEVPKSEAPNEESGVDLSKKYRPRIIGRCKLMFDRFNKVVLQANQFHSFAYSYDGKSGYCADSGPQTSLKLAKEIALSDCEKNKASAESYAPCFIYSIEK